MDPFQTPRQLWRVAARALGVPPRRDYLLSIPPLLAQVEGCIADALILKDIAVSKSGKLYKREHGRLKLDKHGKPVELHGAGQLIHHADFQRHPVLQDMVTLMTTQLIDHRNAILD